MNELVFSSSNEALSYLANTTGRRVVVGSVTDDAKRFVEALWETVRRLFMTGKPPVIGDVGRVNGVNVRLVDGGAVKVEYNMDFVEGGNDARYEFIPDHEIWVDINVASHEHAFIALHELTERDLMTEKHLPYEQAHVVANEAERQARLLASREPRRGK